MKERVVLVNHSDWEATLHKVDTLGFRREDVFYYFDPPFYHKAERLYRFYFYEDQHRKLHDSVTALKSPWVLSYDPAPFILNLYSRDGREPVAVHRCNSRCCTEACA